MKIDYSDDLKNLPLSKFGVQLTFGVDGQVNDYKSGFESIKNIMQSVREVAIPDRGFSTDLCSIKRTNKDFDKLLTSTVKDVLHKNVIGFDIWISQNPTQEMITLMTELQKIIDKSESSTVRIRTYIPFVDRTEKQNHGYLLPSAFFSLGTLLLIGGVYFDKTSISSNWYNGSPTVFIGGVLLLISALPMITKFLNAAKRIKK